MIGNGKRRAHAIFVAALELEPEKRSEHLSSACGGDAAVRREVDRLLAAAQTSVGFLESPALGRAGGAGPPQVRGYRVLRVLGVGGMATVYEAEQESPRRRVALKVMHMSLARTSALQRFRFETEVLARLKHPGIAQIYEAGTCDGPGGQQVPFFAMEFVEDALTITAHARSAGLSTRQRLTMFADACDAVQYGHQVGVIHRDLKPGNVLVDQGGRTKIIDFGIARSVATDAESLTRHEGGGQLLGTLNAMSPEQCAGGHRVDTRTDVYALGVTLYELVTGRLPHDLSESPMPEAIRIIQSVDPPRPGTLTPDAAGDLEAIILMAMDKDPRRRYDGAGSLATDVRRFLESKTVQARLPSPLHHARLFARRHRVLVTATGVIAATVVIASGLTGWFGYRSWRDSAERAVAEQRAIVERDAARRQAYSASISSAFLSYQAGETARGRERLDLAPANLRGWEWGLISALLESDETVIRAHEDMVFAMDAAPAGRRFATASRDGSLALWDLDTGAVVARSPGLAGAEGLSVALAAGGTVYAGFAGGTLAAWTPESGGEVRVVGSHESDLRSLDIDAAGRLACASADGVARIWDVPGATVVHTFEDQPGGVHGVRFSEDGAYLTTWNVDGLVWVRDAATWEPVRELELGGLAQVATMSADGSIVAAGGAEGRLRVWDRASGALLMEAEASSSATSVISLAITPDGTVLYSGTIGRTISEWTIGPGAQPRLVGRHDEAVDAIYLDEQSARLVSASRDRTIRLWPVCEDLEPGPETGVAAHGAPVLSVAFSPSGDLLATAGRDDVVYLWEPALGERLATLRGHDGDIYSVRFSPDGDTLASASSDGSVRLWSTLTGECEDVLGPAAGPATGGLWTIAFSPDGSVLAAAGDDKVVTVWDLESRLPVRSIGAHAERINSIAFDPTGTKLVSCSRDGSVRVWDAGDGRLLRSLEGHTADVFACVFSPDGLRLFTGSRDQTVRVWNASTGEALATLDCRGQFITSLSIDAEGKRLAAGSWFAEVTVWDLRTLDTVLSFKANSAAIRSLAFSPSAPLLVCAGHDGVVTTWSGRSSAERRSARDHARAQLSAAELLLRGSSIGGTPSLADDPHLDSETRQWVRKAMLRQVVEGR
jgi:eukaryotic-like serine/threonine-protein kinase